MIDDYGWLSPAYIKSREDVYDIVTAYLKQPPRRILDIGAGYAKVSELFQKNHGSELWLMDGDFETTKNRPRKAKYGAVDDFKFYRTRQDLEQHYQSQGMQYTFVDAANPVIPQDIKFDLICSWISCGFHYPFNTYSDLIRRHSDQDTVIIMDFRRKSIQQQQNDFAVVSCLNGDHVQKRYTLHVKLP
jgi:SAM-dependent methyltransferase